MPKVTLIKPGTGSTQWGTNVGQNWTDVENTFKQAMYQREVFEIVAEFLNSLNGTPFTADIAGTGSAADTDVVAEASHPGIDRIDTGTDSFGYAAIRTALDCILPGGGATVFEAVVRIPILPDVFDSFDFRIGFGDLAGSPFANGVYFELTQANADWRCKTANSSTRTDTGSSVNAVANTWVRLRIEVNAAWSEAKFYINGTLYATLNTNMPSSPLGIVASIVKTAGNNARQADLDCVYASIDFTTAR